MNKVLLFIVGLVSAASLASAANVVSYTATADPNSAPDAVDQSANPVNVWAVTTTPGGTNGLGDAGADGSGSYFGSPFGTPNLGNAWQMYSFQNDGTGNGGSAFANTTFAGGALTIG